MTKKPSALRVLVVDDELLIRWCIAETLKHRGHTVVEAEDGAAAVRALEDSSHTVDAVVLDYRLPDSNDLSLLAQIRRIVPASPVVLMTAYGGPDIVEGARRLGAYDVMDKPFEMHDLEAVIARACEP
jgi:DNA-binding NtrC family response regulator